MHHGIPVLSARSLNEDPGVTFMDATTSNAKMLDVKHQSTMESGNNSEEARSAQIAKQRVDKVHTVLRSGGKIVAILGTEH